MSSPDCLRYAYFHEFPYPCICPTLILYDFYLFFPICFWVYEFPEFFTSFTEPGPRFSQAPCHEPRVFFVTISFRRTFC
ncbi:hypothetical protein L211DRAFT_702189 [Terfezia boudieri ATCC MYA-4762]|uniref:Uncharacterized protein n=1 Tax=Terfezia boudieri ATCC MYA-4762 TaxID=1051890 RepID=A0A3N4LWZ9_9PEZI|nr:hypothetical protein L211DRAFT_702189 [Terfezia boudieri ATCC MYA-4762]